MPATGGTAKAEHTQEKEYNTAEMRRIWANSSIFQQKYSKIVAKAQQFLANFVQFLNAVFAGLLGRRNACRRWHNKSRNTEEMSTQRKHAEFEQISANISKSTANFGESYNNFSQTSCNYSLSRFRRPTRSAKSLPPVTQQKKKKTQKRRNAETCTSRYSCGNTIKFSKYQGINKCTANSSKKKNMN